ERRVARQTILVAAAHDAGLDARAGSLLDDRHPEVRDGPSDADAEHLLGAGEPRRHGAAGWNLRIAIRLDERLVSSRIARVDGRARERARARQRERGPLDPPPERHPPRVGAAV